jgi:hypothetical protein
LVEENKEKRAVRAMTLALPKQHGIQSGVLILRHSPKVPNDGERTIRQGETL